MRPVLIRSLVPLALIALFAALVTTHAGGAASLGDTTSPVDVSFHSELTTRLAGPSTNLSNGITFDHAVWNDPVRMVGEPDIEVDDQSGIYVSGPGGSTTQSSWFWKSTDHGMQWHLVGCPLKANCQNGGGDTEIAIARNGDVFASDLQTLLCNSTFRSYDRGATWAPSEACIPATDRQWMAVYDPNSSSTGRRVYLSANGQAAACYVLVSTDNGVTYVPPNPTVNPTGTIGGSCQGRYAINKTNGHLYLPNSAGTKVSLNGGLTWLTRARPAGVQANLFANITIDTAGNLYQGWINNHRAFVSYSTNEAQTWSTPVQVSTGPSSPNGNNPDLRQMVMPWTVAGDPGRVAIVYYATTDPTPGETGPGSPNALWYPYIAISTNAMDPNPTWTQVQVDEHLMHRGEICDQGTFCAVVLGDRSLLDFLDVDIDTDGRLYIAYNENSDLSLVVPEPASYIGKPINGVIRLRTGPSLYAANGTLLPYPTPANVDITTASLNAGALDVNGTQGLPPGNWTTDPAGDGAFPVVPVESANHPALDILEASIGDNGTNLTVKMKMADLSPAALADAATAGGTPSWMVTWFTPKAGVGPTPNTGAPYVSHWYMKWLGQSVFEYGLVSSINLLTLGAPSPKVLTYVPSGTATGSVNGNEVTMSVPLSSLGPLVVGDKIDHIQAYANVEHADVTLNDWADQTKSFSYRIGTPAAAQHFADGYVEVALDPDFTNPVMATMNNANNNWTASIPGAPSQGTVYARQVLSKELYTTVWDDVQSGPLDQMSFGPTAVTVRSFIAKRSGQAVVLRWRTASEAQTLGYNLYRQRVKLNKRLIPSVGGSGGHTYVWRDRRPGKAPRYTLEVVRRDGSTVRLARIAASRS